MTLFTISGNSCNSASRSSYRSVMIPFVFPISIAILVNAITCVENVFVDDTHISGPACVYRHTDDIRGICDPTLFTNEVIIAPFFLP